jgi:hypothetical protein
MGGSVLYVVLWSIHHLSAIFLLVWSLLRSKGLELN